LPPTRAALEAEASSAKPSTSSSKSSTGKSRGHRQTEQRRAGRRAHGRQIAQRDGERLVSDRAWTHPGSTEVHVFDERVGADDGQRAAIGFEDRRIVTDAERDPWGRAADQAAKTFKQGVLAERH